MAHIQFFFLFDSIWITVSNISKTKTLQHLGLVITILSKCDNISYLK